MYTLEAPTGFKLTKKKKWHETEKEVDQGEGPEKR